MNKELFMVFLPGISWILFALGGTQISDRVQGWKGWRRFILPLFYAGATLWAGFSIWQAFLVMLISGAVYSLPYGERITWPLRILVGIGYGLISLPIGLSMWNVFTILGFIILFWLSNTKWASSIFTWKICEGFFGLLVGIQLAYIFIGSKNILTFKFFMI